MQNHSCDANDLHLLLARPSALQDLLDHCVRTIKHQGIKSLVNCAGLLGRQHTQMKAMHSERAEGRLLVGAERSTDDTWATMRRAQKDPAHAAWCRRQLSYDLLISWHAPASSSGVLRLLNASPSPEGVKMVLVFCCAPTWQGNTHNDNRAPAGYVVHACVTSCNYDSKKTCKLKA
jgi:hypothetical protein